MRQPFRLANVLPFRGRKQCLRNCVRIAAEITASDTEKTDARTCRKVQVALSAKGQEQTLKLKLCQAGDAAWKVAKS